LGFGVWCLEFRISDFGFRFWGFGFRLLSPYEPRHGPTEGSYGVAFSYERGTPVDKNYPQPPLVYRCADRVATFADDNVEDGGECSQLVFTPWDPTVAPCINPPSYVSLCGKATFANDNVEGGGQRGRAHLGESATPSCFGFLIQSRHVQPIKSGHVPATSEFPAPSEFPFIALSAQIPTATSPHCASKRFFL